MLLLVISLATGCSGVNATGTVNPLMFLVPGLGQNDSEQHPAPAPNTPTNHLSAAGFLAQSN